MEIRYYTVTPLSWSTRPPGCPTCVVMGGNGEVPGVASMANTKIPGDSSNNVWENWPCIGDFPVRPPIYRDFPLPCLITRGLIFTRHLLTILEWVGPTLPGYVQLRHWLRIYRVHQAEKTCMGQNEGYPLVNIPITIEDHLFSWKTHYFCSIFS